MKKTIAVILFVVILGVGSGIDNVHAQSYQFGGYGPHLIAGILGVGTGLTMMAVSDFQGYMFDAGGIVGIVGAIDLGLGLLFMAFDAPAFVKAGEENPAPSDGLYLVKADGEALSNDPSRVSQTAAASPKPKDSIFYHLDFATNGKNTYLGVRFSW